MKLSTYRTSANALSMICMLIVLVINRGEPVTSAINLLSLVVVVTSLVGVVLEVRERRSYRRELGRSSRL